MLSLASKYAVKSEVQIRVPVQSLGTSRAIFVCCSWREGVEFAIKAAIREIGKRPGRRGVGTGDLLVPGERAAEHLGEESGRTEVGQVSLGLEELDGGASAEVRLEVVGDGGRDGDVARGLHDDAGRAHHAQHAAEVGVEHGLAHVERDVRAHVEERAAELLHRRGHVGAHGQRRVPGRPRRVVGLHRVEHLQDLRQLEPAVVVVLVVVEEPGRCADEDELGEELGAADGGEDADHGGHRVADEGAARDAERVEDGEQVVHVRVQRVVPPEVEVLRVHAAGADEVVEHHAVVAAGQVRQHAAPRRLIRPEPVGQHHHALAGAHHPHVQDLQQLRAARRPARAAAAHHVPVGAAARCRRLKVVSNNIHTIALVKLDDVLMRVNRECRISSGMQMSTDPNHYGMFPQSFCNQHVVSFQTSSIASGSGVMPGCLDTSSGMDNLAMLNTTPSTIVSTGSPNMISDSSQSNKYSAPMAVDWSFLELQILNDGLNKYAHEPGIMKYIKIAAMLPDKTVRDVAMRCQWMAARKEATRRRKPEEHYLGKRIKDRKDKMAETSSWVANPPIQTDMRASSFMPCNTSQNNGILYGASQIDRAMLNILEENARLLNEIEVNILTSQAQKNIDLFHRTRRNIAGLQQSMSRIPGIMSKMPPLPVSVDEKLFCYLLPGAPMAQVLGSSHLKEEPRGW